MIKQNRPNYDNYWVPLRAAMKRNLKLLKTQGDLLRKKFSEITSNSTSLQIAMVDLQIQEMMETIDKLDKQMDRTPQYIILPEDTTKPPITPEPTRPPIVNPPIDEKPPIWPRPQPVPTEKPGTRPQPPRFPPWFGGSGATPIIAGFLTIDDGKEMNAADRRFLGMDWFNPPSISDFLGNLFR